MDEIHPENGSILQEIQHARILGTRLFGLEEHGNEALGLLESTIRQLTITGAPTTAQGLIDALRKAGLEDTRNPRFEQDILQLQEYTRAEVERLARHSVLPIAGGVHVVRECMNFLKAGIESGRVLVVGEPGAGKTGVLVSIAKEMLDGERPLIFLSADRLAGVATKNDLKDELALEHELLDVLVAWPGTAPGTLIIDALDASRGGTSERVLTDLIEDGLRKIGHRWSIVASIRTFDLLNGKRLRKIAAGNPPYDAFVEPGLEQVRHFRIPRLSEDEVTDVAQRHPELRALFDSAPSFVRDLLRSVFNLALAVELLEHGALAESIQTIATQSDLIDRYENLRLPSGKLRRAAADAVEVMVNRHRLYVPRIKVKNDAIDEVLDNGVMALAGERVAFTHHVLFDHVAGRFYLDWDDTTCLRDQLANDPAIGLLLGPSLRLGIERIWREDTNGRPKTWDLIASLAAANDIDPIIVGVALRTVAELIADSEDVDALCELLLRIDKAAELGSALSSLARYVGMSISSGNADIASASAA